MKINVLGFNQEEIMNVATSNEVRINVTDLLVLRDVVDLIKGNRLNTKEIDGEVYTWISYNMILEDLPMVATSLETIKKIVSKLVKCGLIDRKVKKQVNGGAFTYFRVTEKLKNIEYKVIAKDEEPNTNDNQDDIKVKDVDSNENNESKINKEDLFVVNEESAKSYAIGMVSEYMTEDLTKSTAEVIDRLSTQEIGILISRLNKHMDIQRKEGRVPFVKNTFVILKVNDLLKELERK